VVRPHASSFIRLELNALIALVNKAFVEAGLVVDERRPLKVLGPLSFLD
jgi:hypothetical protein